MSRAFHRYSLLTLAVGVALIWWGAAVTTQDVGLAVPDWLTSFGYYLFPPGWTQEPAIFLEHGHRLIAQTVGFLVLGMYFWVMRRQHPNWLEAAIIILCGLGFVGLVYAKQLWVALLILLMGFSWLVLTWWARRWPLLRGLVTLALFLVILQASLGGLRVIEMSNPFGITHGTLGQLFYCLLVFIAFASSRTWNEGRLVLSLKETLKARRWTLALFLCVFVQLMLGATVRHTQRLHLAAGDILTTQGHWVPPSSPPDAFLLFLHKYWGFSVALLIMYVAVHARGWLISLPRVRLAATVLMVMPTVQVALGIYVILTDKTFWVTNFHVLNGLAILALTSLLVTTFWAEKLVRKPGPDDEGQEEEKSHSAL